MTRWLRHELRDLARRPLWALALAYVVLALAGTPLARAFGLGAQARLGAEWVAGGGWLFVCGCALALGLTAVRVQPMHLLFVARGAAPWRLTLVRWLAAALALLALCTTVALTYLVAALAFRLPLDGSVAGWAVLLTAEGLVTLSLAALLRQLTGPLLAGASALTLWWAGHLVQESAALARSGTGGPAAVVAWLPDLDLLDGHTALVNAHPLPAEQVIIGLSASAGWICALLCATLWLTTLRPPAETSA